MALTDYGPLFLDDGRVLSVRAHSQSKGLVLCSASEVTSRTQAEMLRGSLLYVSRAHMPEPDEDEIYHADLIGYEVSASSTGQLVGHIIGIFDFGAGSVLEISRKGKKPVMVPFGDAYHPQIDETAEHVRLDIADEWLDDSKPETS